MLENWYTKSEVAKVTSRNRLLDIGICREVDAEDLADPGVMRIAQQWGEFTRPGLKSTHPMGPIADVVNVALMQYHTSLLAQQDSAIQEMEGLKQEVKKLRSRVDRIDALFAREEEIDREIAEEIDKIGGRPVSSLDQKLEDLLPSPDELDELLED